jgi:hypothetical protein
LKITLSNIKTMLGLTDTTKDTKIQMLLPQVINAIANYCRNNFVLYEYETGSIVFGTTTTYTITPSWTLDIPLEAGDWINIRGSKYNDGVYQVKTFVGGVITLETNNECRLETYSCGISICDLPKELLMVVCESIKANLSIRDKSVSIEKVDDNQYTYIQGYNGLLLQSSVVTLNNCRKLFK